MGWVIQLPISNNSLSVTIHEWFDWLYFNLIFLVTVVEQNW